LTDACLDTAQRGLVSPELRDLRVACLHERLDALAAAATLLPTLERTSLRHATRIVEELPAVSTCSDLDRIATRLPEPAEAEHAAALAQARRALAAANVELSAVRIDAAALALDAARRALAGFVHPPFELELALAHARLLILRSDYEGAATRLDDIYHRAFALGHDEVASAASLELTGVLGLDLGQLDRGLAWARHGESLVERRNDALGRASMLDARGKLELRRDPARAVELLDAALVIRRRELGPRSVPVAHTLNELSNALERLGRHEDAKTALAEAIDIKLERLGEFSSSTAGSLTNMGMMLWRAHEYEQAAAHHRHALAVFERAYGPDHRSIAGTSLNLAMALHSLRRADEALPLLERGLAIVAAAGGPPDLEVKLLESIGGAHYQLAHWGPARDAYARALARLREQHGEAAPALASALLGLAEVANGEAEHAEAIAWAEQVLALQPADEPDWVEGFDAHLSLAEALQGLGRRADAREHARRARDGFAATGGRYVDEAAEADALLLALAEPG
jgi:tetratricopeptide (TPR) repeat protein